MKEAREALGLSRPAFTTKYGGSSLRTLENNEAGANEPGATQLEAFVRAGVSANWLLSGQGPMRIDEIPINTALEPGASPQPAQVDAAVLQRVIEFFMKWQEANRDQVRIAPARQAAVITVLYKLAISRGDVVEAELEQILSLAA